MKKTLVALAALAATSAFAQSSVTLYGVADIGYGAKQIENSTGVSQQKQSGIMDGGFAGSRIGFRGNEDLGGGQALGFVVEQGISPTNGALFGVRTGNAGLQLDGYAGSTGKFDQGTGGGYTQGTNRQTYVGVKDNSWGEVRAGYQYTTLYEISTLMGFTTMSEGVIGGSSSHTHGQGAAGGTRANGITYVSPRMSGFGAALQVGSAGGRDTTEFGVLKTNTAGGTTGEKNKRMSFKLDYEQGPMKFAYGHTEFNSAKNATSSNCKSGTLTANNVSTTVDILCTFNVYGALNSYGASGAAYGAFETKLDQYAGVYTASNWKVGAQMTRGTYEVTAAATPAMSNATGVSAGAYSAAGSYDIKSQRISGQYSIGKLDLIAGQGTSSVANAGTKYMDLKETQIGALYNLSKTSKLYMYNGTWKDSAAQATTNTKAKQTIVGLYKAF